MREKAVGFALDAELVHWFARQWVPDLERWTDPRVSPLRAENLSELPRALVVTAEHDPLRDEGEAYARRLAESGVTTTLRRDLGLVHNPIMLARVSPACADALQRVIADVRMLIGSGVAESGASMGANDGDGRARSAANICPGIDTAPAKVTDRASR